MEITCPYGVAVCRCGIKWRAPKLKPPKKLRKYIVGKVEGYPLRMAKESKGRK